MWLTYTVYLFPIDGNSVLRFECVKVSKPFLWCSIIACTKHHKVYHCGSMICFGRMAIVLTLAVATFDSVRESAPEYPIMERSHCSNFGSDPAERSITNWTPQYQYSYWMDLVMDFFSQYKCSRQYKTTWGCCNRTKRTSLIPWKKLSCRRKVAAVRRAAFLR